MAQIRKTRNQPIRRRNVRSGIFLTFEGIEGSGKTTQCHRLNTTLRSLGYSVLETREPGGTTYAEHIRTLLLDHQTNTHDAEQMTAECETALVLAARSQHVTHKILPALARGTVVICDRFTDSTLAYQGYGRKLPLDTLKTMCAFVAQGLTPDLTFLFDLPVKEGLRRRQRSQDQNRLDRESVAFHNRVRKGFLSLADQEPDRIVIMNGKESPEQLRKTIQHHVMDFFQNTRRRITKTRSSTPSGRA
ncbi:MAG: dTMP kinase [Nitrospirales bacterium]|nr:dTMP kinase [Nitrospira sp.]MDR4502117.1 dTMP kinase [Nitrospirales bacterium]